MRYHMDRDTDLKLGIYIIMAHSNTPVKLFYSTSTHLGDMKAMRMLIFCFLGQPIFRYGTLTLTGQPKMAKNRGFLFIRKKIWSKFFFGFNWQIFLYEAYNPIHF